jgi:CRP-like cAMP-binding protein
VIGPSMNFKSFQRVPVFRNLNESECHQLAEIAQEKTFKPLEKIIEQGRDSQQLWIVLDGQCEVTRNHPHDGTSVVLAELEPYSVFGEMSFFSPAPHSATVVAKTQVKLLTIARADYDDLIRDGVIVAYKLAYNVLENVAGKLRRMDEWIAELTDATMPHPSGEAERLPEWRQFRDKLFNGWNV